MVWTASVRYNLIFCFPLLSVYKGWRLVGLYVGGWCCVAGYEGFPWAMLGILYQNVTILWGKESPLKYIINTQ